MRDVHFIMDLVAERFGGNIEDAGEVLDVLDDRDLHVLRLVCDSGHVVNLWL